MNNGFIRFADLPPNPLDQEALREYQEMGMNVCLLTEDDVKLVSDGAVSTAYQTAIQNISDTGMQVWIRNMFNDKDYFICEHDKKGSNYGSPYEMAPRNITAEFQKFPGVTGFYMADEAYMYQLPENLPVSWMSRDAHKFASFDQLVKLVDWKNTYYPDAFFHMNHVPGQSWDHFLPRNGRFYNYEEFLTAYCEVILKRLTGGPRSLCIDNYPFIGKDYLEKDYLCDLLTGAQVTKRYNSQVEEANRATFGICLQTFHAFSMTYERHRDIISAEEITFQMYVGIALGAKLFEYFCYRSYKQEMIGICYPDGSKRLWNLVKTANDRVAPMEKAVLDCTWQGAFAVTGRQWCENAAAFIMAKDRFCAHDTVTVDATGDTLVGCLEKNGKPAYVLVNYSDPIRQHTDTVMLSCHGAQKYYVLQGGQEQIVTPDDGVLKLTLKEGDGAFVLPQP